MAQRLRFTRNFDFRVKPTVTIAYKAGMDLLVPDGAAKAALQAGAAEAVEQAPQQVIDDGQR
ncbi:MAG: hypothetical protein JWQ03_3239 [Variovorax sp.]|nr:hypothetical protein [Variovorax sp.]